MSSFVLSGLHNPTPWGLYRMRHLIDLSPTYQRDGGIWAPQNRQLLIDTIINRFDVPKIYIHQYSRPVDKDGSLIEYSVVDGRQRLETIFGFIEGKFGLSEDFEYFHDDGVNAGGFTYSDLAREYPEIKSDFDSGRLDIVVIQTDDIELIEEMFSRLNEAVPLNAAEKRNAKPGPLPKAVRDLTGGVFWLNKVPFTNARYRHFDLVAKMLYIESKNSVVDTKKAYVDKFFDDNRNVEYEHILQWLSSADLVMQSMVDIFVDRDPLLRSVGMIILYYHVFRRCLQMGQKELVTRPKLLAFEERRKNNRRLAEENITDANYNLLEFDRFAQSPNDAIALRFRLLVIDKELFEGFLGFEPPMTTGTT